MKKLCFVFSLSLLCACAGNPPQWWNPSGTYGGQSPAASSHTDTAKPSLSVQTTQEEEEPYPMEQSIEPVMESYEELSLSPLAPTVDAADFAPQAESSSAAAAPQTEPAPASAPAYEAEPMQEAAEEAYPPEPENLPADGSLPPPSVLQ